MAERNTFFDDVESLVVIPGELRLSYASDTVGIYTNTTLPRPELIRDALEAYCRYSGALFSLFPIDEIRELYKKVYWTAGGASRGTLCALCALASLGYHYDVESADLQVIQKFYNTAKLYLDVCLEEDRVYGMRVMVLLATNYIMEKKTAAWTYIGSAMSIAKDAGFASSHWNEDNEGHNERLTYQKNWMTTVFFHTWLTATVRSYPRKLPYDLHDVVVLAARIKSVATTRVDRIRSEMHSIGIILAGVLRDAPNRGEVSIQVVQMHTARTEEWILGLPDFMKLNSLLQGDPVSTIVQRRTTLLVHMLFQGACMQLHRPSMLYLAQIHKDSPWTLDGTQEQAAESADTCVRSALQTAQIVFILMSDNSVFKRCWIVIHQSFVAALILLFNAGQKRKHGAPPKTYKDESEKIKICLQALEFCGTIDRMAKGYHARLSSYQAALLRPYSFKVDGRPTTSDATISQAFDASTLMTQHPRHVVEIFDQPFFEAVHRETGDWQDPFPQWLQEDEAMVIPPGAGLFDGVGEDEL